MTVVEELLSSIEADLAQCREAAQAVDLALDRVLGWRKYFWIGVYRVEGKRARRVDFRGPMPPCHEFEFGKGNVGTAAMTGLKKVVPDVTQDPTYSLCFIQTKSELILPIRSGEKVVGVMDVESDRPDFFTEEDERVLAAVCGMLAPFLEKPAPTVA